MGLDERTNLIHELATAAGFERVGVARAGPIARADYLRAWLADGRAGEMTYLARWADLREDPRLLLPGARSVIVVAQVYRQPEGDAGKHPAVPLDARSSVKPERVAGRIAQYAWGRDYHKVLRRKLHRLVDKLRTRLAEPFETRVCVDTAPMLERELAVAAGIGWIGKNTLVMHQELGSYFFLGEIITTLELAASEPVSDHCGTCTRCLDACPTQAFLGPYQMDASRCISYLTIEHGGEIAPKLRPHMGEWVFGCDVCQEVCPHNRRAPTTREVDYLPRQGGLGPRPDLDRLANLQESEYRAAVQGSAVKRATLDMLRRNASIARDNARRRDGETERMRDGENR